MSGTQAKKKKYLAAISLFYLLNCSGDSGKLDASLNGLGQRKA